MKTHPWLAMMGLTLLGGCGGVDALGPARGDPPGGPTVDGEPGVGGPNGGMAFPPPNLPSEPVTASRALPPISGGTLTVSPDGKLAVAADPDRDNVYLINLATLVHRVVHLEPGAEPGRVAFDGAGRAHVVLRSAGELAQIDTTNATVLRQSAVCGHPRGLAYQASTDALLVACASGDLVRLAAADHAEQARTLLDLDLRDVVITNEDKALVSTFRAAELIEVNAQGAELTRARPATLQASRFEFDPMTGEPKPPKQVTLKPRIAWRTALRPDGKALMLHQRSQEEEVVVGPGGYGGGCASVTETTITELSSGQVPTAGWSFGSATTAVDFAASANGRWFAVASAGSYLQGSGTVQVYSATGVPPVPPDSTCTFPVVDGGYGAQATAVSFDPAGRLLVQSREPAQIEVFTVVEHEEDYGDGTTYVWPELRSDGVLLLDEESMRDTGHDLFHANVGGGIACASCHPEGRDDGHTWTFAGFGPRRTQNMGGGLASTAPFHWDGDMTSFQHLVDEVMTGRMGGFVVEPKYANALLSWIDHLPALTLPVAEQDPVAMSKVERGKALFQSSNCAACHSGPAFTNNASVDVGTGGAFQVPSLRGLGLRGPFMHDGCATDLVSRFAPSCGGGDRHGTTSQLSTTEITDLAAYLSTL